MKARHLLGIALAVGFLAGVLSLFGVHFASGDVYPEYSSLRSDPAGSKLLFDALSRVRGLTVARNYVPLPLVSETNAAILLLGSDANSFVSDSDTQQQAERLSRRGNRMVIALTRRRDAKPPDVGSLYRNWDVKIGLHAHGLHFTVARGWNVLERAGERIIAIERAFDKGSVVLFTESEDFGNIATVASDRLEIVTAAIGPSTRIVFDEVHLGIAESGSFVGLARRFRLSGMALGLAICAALLIWHVGQGAWPVQPGAEGLSPVPGSPAGLSYHSGLLTLLRRHVKPAELADTCWDEWLAANRRTFPPGRVERAAAIVRAGSHRPVEAIQQAHAVLHSKGVH
jgi:hypothetical protein